MKDKIITAEELKNISSCDINEELVNVLDYAPKVISKYLKDDMKKYLGEVIMVRRTVAERLGIIQGKLENINPTTQIYIAYGYRHPDIQKEYFQKRRSVLASQNPNLPEDELDELTHHFVAVPEVAGHPTGGAVDVTLLSDGKFMDMGTKIADFTNPELLPVYSNLLTERQQNNRLILRNAFLSEGFAPYNGEWWHFSYGDKEWACYYKQPKALYDSITLRDHQ